MFENREDAARKLADVLRDLGISSRCDVVIGITRGGAVVGKIVAEELGLPFDVIVVKKIGSPRNPEFAIGAVGPNNTTYYNRDILNSLRIPLVELLIYREQKEKERRLLEKKLRAKQKPLHINGKAVIVVDDGIATGASVFCAIESLAKKKPSLIILAVPVIALEIREKLASRVDTLVTLVVAKQFEAVGNYYEEFSEVMDSDVAALFDK